MPEYINNKIINILKPFIINNINEIEYNSLLCTEISILDIIKLLYSDYIIFLTGKYFKNKLYFNFKSNLLKYFNKYNIVYLNYEYRNKIINLINLMNVFIKNSDNNTKKNLINEILIYVKIKNNFFDISKKLKQIHFLENNYEPNILYKKIQFSNQEIFIPFDSYIIKKMEYKLRTFCQIAEKLGAEKIVIEYISSVNEDNNINIDFDIFSSAIGANINKNNSNDQKIQIIFEYPNNHFDINLNKFFIIDSILKENEFLITKEEFQSDLELNFLIDTRCINFIQKYNTNFIINHINKVEQKIFMKAHNYGLNIGNLSLKNNYINISISIDFIQIHNNIDIIDGTNIHVLREGFTNLCNIIKKNDKYDSILRFLQSHLNAIEKKWISLNYSYDNIQYINKIYHNIIDLNFKEEEICDTIKVFFKNNLTWHNFKKFRDIILFGSDDQLEKLYFVTFQYHDIMNNKKYIINDINKYIDNMIDNYINNIFKIKINEKDIKIKYDENKHNDDKNNDFEYCIDNYVDNNEDYYMDNKHHEFKNSYSNYNIIDLISINVDQNIIIEFIQNNKNIIKYVLYEAFKKSFKFNNGLSDNLSNVDKLTIVIKNIINYYFNNEIKNLQSKLNTCSYSTNKDVIFNIKKLFFDKIVQEICTEIIKNLNILDTSPNINILENNEKESLHIRTQKIFIKFIIKFFDFENKTSKIINKLKLENNYIENDNLDPKFLLPFLNNFIPINKTYKNYNKYKIFYTWEDFISIKNYFNEYIDTY
jgi:hypothetical protein